MIFLSNKINEPSNKKILLEKDIRNCSRIHGCLHDSIFWNYIAILGHEVNIEFLIVELKMLSFVIVKFLGNYTKNLPVLNHALLDGYCRFF